MNTPALQWNCDDRGDVRALERLLSDMGSALVALSGGIDSSLLMAIAARALGDRALAVTGVSATFPSRDRRDTEEQVRAYGWRHRFVETDELGDERFASNPPNRCYFCKSDLFAKLADIARAEGLAFVIDGSNTDDLSDFRPGARAKREAGVRSPFQEAGVSKAAIREIARSIGLMTAEKAASACLASRIPYGERIEKAALDAVDKAEEFLRERGYSQVRVRVHRNVARIEVPSGELERVMSRDERPAVSRMLKSLGFLFVTVDIDGYRTGSQNEALAIETEQA